MDGSTKSSSILQSQSVTWPSRLIKVKQSAKITIRTLANTLVFSLFSPSLDFFHIENIIQILPQQT